ncbi:MULTISPECIES: ATP-binding protein [unclassified Streptomyces]|uniref:ATP-binding protein n=1 Tax=unclassified Streptomyces TaxID=2593676 RepID=UPI002DDC27E4|nr:ATP-binding protein [Streptomyces sp. NBC_00243]WRZ23340.1 ATP-binding protein [Streptomyces sp. NBC_00243]
MASVTPSVPLGTDAAEDRCGPGAAAQDQLGPGAAIEDRSGLRAAAGPRSGLAAERRFRFELAAHPGSVARARRLTDAWLSGWAVCEDTCDTATLVISELVTNAIVHTAGERVVCELHHEDDLVRIAVRDEGCAPGEPRPSSQRPEEEHGRGLLLVEAMCRAWGAQETGPGLLVWAELEHSSNQRSTSRRDVSTEPRSDLGWSAKKPPADGRGAGTEACWGMVL